MPLPWEAEQVCASDLCESATRQATLKREHRFRGKRTVEAYLHRPEFELDDLQEDPDEAHDLTDDPKRQTKLEEMKAQPKAFQQRTQNRGLSSGSTNDRSARLDRLAHHAYTETVGVRIE